MNSRILDKLRKIRELALNGYKGERSGAQELFDSLVKKYNLEDYDFDDEEEIKEYDLIYHGNDERQLLLQVYYKVTNSTTTYAIRYTDTGRLSKTIMRVECTESQYIETEFLFDFYKRLWYEEVKILLSAFIQKHKLFGNPDDPSDNGYDEETLARIMKMTRDLKDATPLKQIEG